MPWVDHRKTLPCERDLRLTASPLHCSGQIERLRSIQLGFHSKLSYVMVPKEALRVLRTPRDCCHRAAVYFAVSASHSSQESIAVLASIPVHILPSNIYGSVVGFRFTLDP